MTVDLLACVVRVLGEGDDTAGTGFIVSKYRSSEVAEGLTEVR